MQPASQKGQASNLPRSPGSPRLRLYRTALGHRRRRGARGGEGRGDRLGWGRIRILYKAPKDYTKPRNTIHRHRILDKEVEY